MDITTKTNLPFSVARLILLLFAAAACARAQLWDEDWSGAFDLGLASRHVRHGAMLADEVLQPRLRLGNGAISLATWSAVPLRGAQQHELGMSVGLAREWGDTWRASAEVVALRWQPPPSSGVDGTIELGAALERRAGPGRWVLALRRDSARRATFAEIAYAGDLALTQVGAFLGYRVYGGTAHGREVGPLLSGRRTADAYAYHGADLTLPYRVGGATIVTLGVHYARTSGLGAGWTPLAASDSGRLSVSVAATFEL